MSPTGEWIPENAAGSEPLDTHKLRKLADISAQGRLDDIDALLSDPEQQSLARAMQAPRERWQQAAATLTDAELVDLIKALATAEMRLPNCDLGPRSAVIHINHVLKRRGRRLGEDDLRWLKQHSSNRFLPNGPAL